MRIITTLLLLLSLTPAAKAEEASFQNGHNLSVTSDLLEPGHCSIGIPVTACGVMNRLTLGFSPWMYLDYNMLSLAARYLLDEDEQQNRLAIQANYFNTYRDRDRVGRYQMEAFWLMLIRTWHVNDHYRAHLNFHSNYYLDEKLPFSLRRPYNGNTPWQFNLSLLHEMKIAPGWFIFGETGVLDFLRSPVHLHGGASIGKQIGGFSLRIGFSATGSPTALFSAVNRRDYQQHLHHFYVNGYDTPREADRVKYDFSIHPEFSLQYTF